MSDSLWPHGPQPARLFCPWDSPGKNTAVGCHFLLQGVFPTQGWKPSLLCLLHWQTGSFPLASLAEFPVLWTRTNWWISGSFKFRNGMVIQGLLFVELRWAGQVLYSLVNKQHICLRSVHFCSSLWPPSIISFPGDSQLLTGLLAAIVASLQSSPRTEESD